MDTTTVYNHKAEKYARSRWEYSPLAVETIFDIARIDDTSTVVDLGAGTGILTRQFYGKVEIVIAVEPNAEMRAAGLQAMPPDAACEWIDARAEDTGLPDHSVDLITVATALNWFDPEPVRREFRRILKPGGWLAVLWNEITDPALGRASAELCRVEYGYDPVLRVKRPERKPLIYYFGSGRFHFFQFPFSFTQDFNRYFGAILSISGMPDESHPAFPRLEQAAREVFTRFSEGGSMQMEGITNLYIGQVSGGVR